MLDIVVKRKKPKCRFNNHGDVYPVHVCFEGRWGTNHSVSWANNNAAEYMITSPWPPWPVGHHHPDINMMDNMQQLQHEAHSSAPRTEPFGHPSAAHLKCRKSTSASCQPQHIRAIDTAPCLTLCFSIVFSFRSLLSTYENVLPSSGTAMLVLNDWAFTYANLWALRKEACSFHWTL